jgi:enoyl-CoA hydratase
LSDQSDPPVIIRRQGRIGRITLNRPRSLNALTLPMVHAVAAALAEWRDDASVHAVVTDAAGGRVFCAGGDVRELRRLSLAGEYAEIERFFVDEYALNLVIARYPKPVVSLIDGVCMGGGIGLSVHGAIRVATEAAVFAMPETAIGFFPDVGATFLLPRLRGLFGLYLGLTGARVHGADATWLGLATHYVPQAKLPGLADAIARDGIAALADHAEPPPVGPLQNLNLAPFAAGDVPGIIAALEQSGTPWAQETLAALRAVSPTALLWSFEILRRGAAQTLEQCQASELALTRRAVRGPDFLEGVRAMLVDKDRTPIWSPRRIEDVAPAAVATMFDL